MQGRCRCTWLADAKGLDSSSPSAGNGPGTYMPFFTIEFSFLCNTASHGASSSCRSRAFRFHQQIGKNLVTWCELILVLYIATNGVI